MSCRFETELAMRQSVESDIAGLKTLKKEYESTNTMLRQEVTALDKECATIKKLHQEVRTRFSANTHKHLSSSVDV